MGRGGEMGKGKLIKKNKNRKLNNKLSRRTTKPTVENAVRPAKTHISLGIRPVWSVFAVRFMDSSGPKCFLLWTAKTLIRPGRCAGWYESSLSTQVVFVGFVMLLLSLHILTSTHHWHVKITTKFTCFAWILITCWNTSFGYMWEN